MDIRIWRWAGILLLLGGLIFWTGAFTPPYKWWMTNDYKEYLSLIYRNKPAWYFIHASFVIGIIVTIIGIQVISAALQSTWQKVLTQIASTFFTLGSVLWILNIAFRCSVTIWAANQLSENNLLEPSFKTWMDWTNLLFAIYMILAYFSIGCLGYSLKKTAVLPAWTTWMCVIYGFGGSFLYLCHVPVFEPPLMVHTPLIICGIIILLKIRT